MKASTVQRSLKQLARLPDFSQDDAPSRASLGATFWKSAVPVYPSLNRRLVRLRLDPEIVDWFGVQREDVHGGVNAVLRAYVERKRADEKGAE
jgi:uncharacterized protein (DUF4415 family)